MGEYKAQEDPITPLSLQGLAKSSFVLLHIFRARPTPQITFLVAIILWICFFVAAPVCLAPEHVRTCSTDDWKIWALHGFAPQSFLRTSLIGTLLLTVGYSIEDRIGMIPFLGIILFIHFGLGTLLLYCNLSSCYYSLEYTLAALAPIFHFNNPIFHGDSIGKNIRVPFAIEPRWHYWILVFLMMVTRAPFDAQAVYSYFIGLVIGTMYALRQPAAWTFKLSLTWPKQVMFLLVVLFVPVTTLEVGVWDGPSVMALSQGGLLGAGNSVVTLSLCLLPLSALAAHTIPWFPKAVYAVSSGLLAMYSMDSDAWVYPGPGFLALWLLVVAFLLKK